MSIEKIPYKIGLKKKRNNIVKSLPNSILYSPSIFGINNGYTGKGVKIAILDSGCPRHKDIKYEGNKISLCEENSVADDKNGHATIISGVIKANSKTLIGIAPDAKMLYGKVIENNGQSSFNSLIAGILWAIVKDVDIIVIAMGTKYDYRVLYDAIKKAKEYGICVFAAAGENEEIDYPAKYKEAFSAGFLTRYKAKNKILKKNVDFCLPNKGIYTTYLNNEYTKVTGSSISTAFFAGLAAVLIEQYKEENKTDIPKLVYKKLKTIF